MGEIIFYNQDVAVATWALRKRSKGSWLLFLKDDLHGWAAVVLYTLGLGSSEWHTWYRSNNITGHVSNTPSRIAL